MKFSPELKKTYIPKFNGNRDLDPTEQVVVEYDMINSITAKSVRPKRDVNYKYDTEGAYTGMDMKIITDDFSLINNFAPRIKNFSYPNKEGDWKKITNAQTLFEAPINVGSLLIKELVEIFRKDIRDYEATEEEVKNSE